MTRMSIGDFAKAAGLTVKALRLYDEMRLVTPAAVDESNGYRWYDLDQVAGARTVARLRLAGMPLARIREVMDLPGEARSAELLSWWRQVEADHVSRRGQLTLLVETMRDQEEAMQLELDIKTSVAARIGQGQRDRQLDAVHRGSRLFAVADGFGEDAQLSGAVAAALAEEEPMESLDPVAFLDALITRVGAAVAQHPGTGTTLTALFIGDGRAAIAHVGDTRIHLVRDGRMERLTRDHTFVQALVDEGRLTPEEARLEEDRILLNRAISADVPAEPDLSIIATRPNDRFVLTTDGVHAVLAGPRIAELSTSSDEPDAIVDAIEQAVIDAGAPDNYAVLVVDLGENPRG